MLRFYLFAVGCALVVYGAIATYSQALRLSRWATAHGVVVSSVERLDPDDGSTVVYFARIAFSTKDGHRIEFTSRVGGTRALAPGRAICVRFDPDDPNRAIENSVVAKWGFSTLISLLGVTSLVAAALL